MTCSKRVARGNSPGRAQRFRRECVAAIAVAEQPAPVSVVSVEEALAIPGVVEHRVAPRVAGEQFVAAGPSHHDLHELRRQPSHEVVLVAGARTKVLQVPHQFREHTRQVAGVQNHPVVLGAHVAGDDLGVRPLVGRHFERRRVSDVKAGGERVNVRNRSPREHDQRGRVHPARQVRADGHVGHQLAIDGALERGSERLRKPAVARRRLGGGDGVVVRAALDRPVVRHAKPRPRRQHRNPLEQRVLAVGVLERHVLDQRRERQPCRLTGEREDRLDLRSEHQPARVLTQIQRLGSEAIAREQQLVLAAVPDREREDPIEAVEHAHPPFLVAVHEHFAVGVRDELVAARLEQPAQLAVVVDLAVVGQPDRVVLVGHRLMACLAQVDDRQAPVSEPDRPVEVKALVVGPAVSDAARGPAQRLAIDRRAVITNCSCDSAHGLG